MLGLVRRAPPQPSNSAGAKLARQASPARPHRHRNNWDFPRKLGPGPPPAATLSRHLSRTHAEARAATVQPHWRLQFDCLASSTRPRSARVSAAVFRRTYNDVGTNSLERSLYDQGVQLCSRRCTVRLQNFCRKRLCCPIQCTPSGPLTLAARSTLPSERMLGSGRSRRR